MALISEEIRGQIQGIWKDLEHPVTFHYYPKRGDGASDAMDALLTEFKVLHPLVCREDDTMPPAPLPPETADDLESSVTTITVDGRPTGLRYLGFPGGHEFGPLVQLVRDLSRGEPSELSADTRATLAGVARPLHLQVFVTYT